MIRKLCIVILAVTLTVPIISKPAEARSDLENFLAALTAIGIVAAVAKSDRKKHAVVQPAPKPKHYKKRHKSHKAKHKHCKHHKRTPARSVRTIMPPRGHNEIWVEQGRRAYHAHGSGHRHNQHSRYHRH